MITVDGKVFKTREARIDEAINALVEDLKQHPEFVTAYSKTRCTNCFGRGTVQWSHPDQWGYLKGPNGEEIKDDKGNRVPFTELQYCTCVYNYIRRQAEKMVDEQEEVLAT